MENVVLNVKSPTGETVRILHRRGDSAKGILGLVKDHFGIRHDRVVMVVEGRPDKPIHVGDPIPVSDIHGEQDLEILLRAVR